MHVFAYNKENDNNMHWKQVGDRFFTIYTAPLLKNISAWDHFGNFG